MSTRGPMTTEDRSARAVVLDTPFTVDMWMGPDADLDFPHWHRSRAFGTFPDAYEHMLLLLPGMGPGGNHDDLRIGLELSADRGMCGSNHFISLVLASDQEAWPQ